MKKDGYFYLNESEMFKYFKIPYALINQEYFEKMSLHAKLLYGLLLDRIGWSKENGWVDDNGRVYIIFTIEEIIETLHFSKSKAISLLKELEEFGLVEKKRRGLNKANLLYVKDFTMFVSETSGSVKSETSEEKTSGESDGAEAEIEPPIATELLGDERKNAGSIKYNTTGSLENGTSGSIENDTSGGIKNELLEVSKMVPNNQTNFNQTDLSQPESNQILSYDASDQIGMRVSEVRAKVHQNLQVDKLIGEHPEDKELIESIVNLITEILLINKPQIWLAKKLQSTELVRERLLGLTASHVEYVITSLEKNAKNVGNVRNYLLATLFNAPVTFQAAKKIKDGQKDIPECHQKPANRFINYKQSAWDFDDLEQKERKQRDKFFQTLRGSENEPEV